MCFLSIVPLLNVIIFVLSVCSFTLAAPSDKTEVTDVTQDYYNNFYVYILQSTDTDYIDGGPVKTRVKRQTSGGAGKFAESASMGPMKVIQLFLSFAKNVFSGEPIGGVHPMSRSIPGPVVKLLKETLFVTFFPSLKAGHEE